MIVWVVCRRKVEEVKKSSFFFQAEDGIRGVEGSRGLGDVYKGQEQKKDPQKDPKMIPKRVPKWTPKGFKIS